MKHRLCWRRLASLCRFLLAFSLLLPAVKVLAQPLVLRLEIHDTLQPERARIFSRDVERANREGYSAIVVDLSTPGGLPGSVDLMVTSMQQSAIPVVVWVGSPQTRVSGEGLRLLAAADLALMNPQAFLTPLWTDHARSISTQQEAESSQRLLVDLTDANRNHGRDAGELEELASGKHWFPASEAVDLHLVDAPAEHMGDVLRLLGSRHVRGLDRQSQQNMSKARVDTRDANLREMLLLALMNPDLCVLLLALGLLLIYLEINTPGTVIPGASGVLVVLLAAYALRQLPLNKLGLLLCVFAIVFLLLEGAFATHGVLAGIGVVALIAGLGVLVNGPIPQLEVGWPTAVGAGLGFGGITAALIVLGTEARRAKVKTGAGAMLGWLAVTQTALAPEGQILVRGELWNARLASQDTFVVAGARVKVVRAEGTLLEVVAVPLGDGA